VKLEDITDSIRDYKPRTPVHTLKEFLDGTIHTDFLNEIHVRIESMRDFNEECDSKSYLETRGGIKALRLVAQIFHDLHDNAKDDTEREEKRK